MPFNRHRRRLENRKKEKDLKTERKKNTNKDR